MQVMKWFCEADPKVMLKGKQETLPIFVIIILHTILKRRKITSKRDTSQMCMVLVCSEISNDFQSHYGLRLSSLNSSNTNHKL